MNWWARVRNCKFNLRYFAEAWNVRLSWEIIGNHYLKEIQLELY